METNSTELEEAIQRIPPAPGYFICHCDSRAPVRTLSFMKGGTFAFGSSPLNPLRLNLWTLRATVGYLLSFEPELMQVVTAGGLTLSIRFPP